MKAVLYARVSSEAQDVSLSISAQLKALREYAERNGHFIIREFVEEAETGRSITKRPAFREMIALARSPTKPFDAVLIWKYSRFARNRADSIVYKTLLRKQGVQVISITEPAENSPTGRLMEAIIEGMDEYYSDNLGEEVTRGMRESVSRGFYLSSKAPYGYRKIRVKDGSKERTRLELDPSQAPTVVGIFNDVLAGKGLIQIVKKLNQSGIAGPKGKAWGKTGIRTILWNEIYTGTFVWGRNSRRGNPPMRSEDAFPAIISKEQFLKVQQLMGDRTLVKNHPRRTASRFLLSGLAFCGHCGKALVGQDAKSGKFSYYVCGTLNKKGAGACKATYLNSSKFERLVVSKIKEHILTPDNLTRLVEMVNEEMDAATSSYGIEMDTIEKEISDVNRRLGNIYNAIENGNIDYELLKPRLLELKAQHDKLLARKAELELLTSQRKIELADTRVVGEYVDDLYRFLDCSDLSERKAFVKSFIKEITVTGHEGRIRYTLPLPSDNNAEEKLAVLPIVQYSGR
jgi:DNA invertase Pin-like site-specific DNA recombinase